jgi:hypothetical protein
MAEIALRWMAKVTADWVPDRGRGLFGGTWVYNAGRASAYADTHWGRDLDVRARVGAAYEVLLGRAPDAKGWRYWVDQVELRSFGRVLEDLWRAAKVNGESFAPTTDAASWAQGLFHLFLDRDPTDVELAAWSEWAGVTAASRMSAAAAFVDGTSISVDRAEIATLLHDLSSPGSVSLGVARSDAPQFQGSSPPARTPSPQAGPTVVVIDNGWHAEAVIQCIREHYAGPVMLRDVGSDAVSGETILEQVRWAIDNATTHGIKVINLSWADTPGVAENQWSEYHGWSPVFREAVSRGISVVVSAGNHGSMSFLPDDQWDRPYWALTSGLADSSYVLAASAVLGGSTVEDYAPYSATVDVYTSGSVRYEGSLAPSLLGQTVRGTSFAAPRVSGAIAAIQAAAAATGATVGQAELRAALRLGASYEEAHRNTTVWVGTQRTAVPDASFGPGASEPQQRWFWSDGLARAAALAGGAWDGIVDPRTRVAAAYDFLLGRAPDPEGWRFWVDHLEDHDFTSVLRSIWAAAVENDDVANAQSGVADWVSALFILFLDRFPTDAEFAAWIARGFQDVPQTQYGIVPRTTPRSDVALAFVEAYRGELDLDMGSIPEIVRALGLDGGMAAQVFRDLTPAGLRGYDLAGHEGWQPFRSSHLPSPGGGDQGGGADAQPWPTAVAGGNPTWHLQSLATSAWGVGSEC